MNEALYLEVVGNVCADLCDFIKRDLAREDYTRSAHFIERVGGGVVRHARLCGDMKRNLRRVLLGELKHAEVGDDERVNSAFLRVAEKRRQVRKLSVARQHVAGDVNLPAHAVSKTAGFLQVVAVKVLRRGTHTELLPREVDRVGAIAQRRAQALHIARGS